MPMTANEIFAKLMEIDGDTCIRYRNHCRPDRKPLYLSLRNTVFSNLYEDVNDIEFNGATTEQVLTSFWNYLLEDHAKNPDNFLVVYAHPDGANSCVETQAWVRWDKETNDWMDVASPSEDAMKKHRATLVLSYTDEDIHYQ
jgi:hypothetical protein